MVFLGVGSVSLSTIEGGFDISVEGVLPWRNVIELNEKDIQSREKMIIHENAMRLIIINVYGWVVFLSDMVLLFFKY